jgi:pimeloyl-ACP methyl ester carboxylesterase
VVGLSYGGSVVFAMLGRHPDLIDRAVIDGAGVLPWWGDRLVLLGVAVVSPMVGTRLVAALLGLIGLREVGSALRSVSPRAFRRSYQEGFLLIGADIAQR